VNDQGQRSAASAIRVIRRRRPRSRPSEADRRRSASPSACRRFDLEQVGEHGGLTGVDVPGREQRQRLPARHLAQVLAVFGPFGLIEWGSPTMNSEYPVARDVAASSGPKLIVAHASEMVSAQEAGIFVDSTEILQAILERTVDDLRRAGLDTELGLVQASQSNAAQAIADLAKNIGADMVVVGNPRLRAGRRRLPRQLHVPLALARAVPGRRRSHGRPGAAASSAPSSQNGVTN
jgi:nucleotide-binding universal stress UspA family protein